VLHCCALLATAVAVPTAQLTHTDANVVAAPFRRFLGGHIFVLMAHSAEAVTPFVEPVRGHCMQATLPAVDENVSDAQFVHEDAPVNDEYLPDAQSMHDDAFIVDEYVPTAQSMHDEAIIVT
jgi:hypothetical protein